MKPARWKQWKSSNAVTSASLSAVCATVPFCWLQVWGTCNATADATFDVPVAVLQYFDDLTRPPRAQALSCRRPPPPFNDITELWPCCPVDRI